MATRGRRALLAIGVTVAVLVALAVVADLVVRSLAQQAVAAEVERRLPEGVEGDVDAEVRGFSVLAQLLAGRADEVVLTAPDLVVAGSPLSAEVVARGVPLAMGEPADRVDVRLDVPEASVNALVQVRGVPAGFGFGDGVVRYGGTADLLGFQVGYEASAEPEAAGDRVLLRPVGVEVTSDLGSVDATGLVERLTGGEPLAVCAAQYLPAGFALTDVAPTDGAVRLDLTAEDVVLDGATFATRGACG